MRLVLVRHGQTTANVAGALDTGEPGELLTEQGEEQARELVERLHGRPIDALFASPLTRTQQTLAPLAQVRGLEPRVLQGLREIIAGDLEMNTDKESVILYHEVAGEWAHGNLERRMPGAESGAEVFERFGAALAEIREAVGEGGTAVAVAHGAIIRTWGGWGPVNADPDFAVTHVLPNTGIVELESEGEGWRAVEWTGEPL